MKFTCEKIYKSRAEFDILQMPSGAKNYFITDWGADTQDEWLEENPYVRYVCVGNIEECPSTKRNHFHVYVQLYDRHTVSWFRRNVRDGDLNLKIADGTPADGRNYAGKLDEPEPTGIFHERGTAIRERQRTDLDGLKQLVLGTNKPMHEIVEHVTNYQQLRFAESLIKYRAKPRPKGERPECIWMWGDAGRGKDHRAEEFGEDPNDVWWATVDAGAWYDGYTGQSVAIFPDFDREFITFRRLLKIIDRYPVRANVKGGYTYFSPKKIIFTADITPEEMFYDVTQKKMEQLISRFSLIREVKGHNHRGPGPVRDVVWNNVATEINDEE